MLFKKLLANAKKKDEDCHLRNVFWADARSKAVYETLGDVISFDSIYLTNNYDILYLPFIKVNHHRQTISLDCGLLSNGEIKTNVVVQILTEMQ